MISLGLCSPSHINPYCKNIGLNENKVKEVKM